MQAHIIMYEYRKLEWNTRTKIFKNGVNYYVTKSCPRNSKKKKCAMKDGRGKWKIIASYRKKIEMSMIKKHFGPHTCFAMGASQDHPRLDSEMISNIILQMVRAIPWIQISVLITNIRSQYQYTPTYYTL